MTTFMVCGSSMSIEPAARGLRVCKVRSRPEFGVALTAPLPARENVHRLQACFNGDCNFFALGVAVGARQYCHLSCVRWHNKLPSLCALRR